MTLDSGSSTNISFQQITHLLMLTISIYCEMETDTFEAVSSTPFGTKTTILFIEASTILLMFTEVDVFSEI